MAKKNFDPVVMSDEEREVVETLFQKYYTNVYEYFRRKVFFTHEAEELAAETFLRVSIKAADFVALPDNDRVKLLYGFSEKVFLMSYRKSNSRKTDNFSDHECENEDGEYERIEDNILSDDDVAETAVNNELIVILKREINRLPMLKRKAMTLMYYNGMKTDEIAKELGMNPSTLRSMISNTYKYLKKRLEK